MQEQIEQAKAEQDRLAHDAKECRQKLHVALEKAALATQMNKLKDSEIARLKADIAGIKLEYNSRMKETEANHDSTVQEYERSLAKMQREL